MKSKNLTHSKLVGAAFLRPYIIRGDWRFIASGDFLAGKKDIQSSVSLRIRTYKNFLEYTVKQPFKGVGLGRQNIKRLMPDVIERAGLVHGHNVFLNYAVPTGIAMAVREEAPPSFRLSSISLATSNTS